MSIIKFYKPKEPYYEFSNFYTKNPIEIDGKMYINVEQFYQSHKFMNTERGKEYAEIICMADSPLKVKILGSQKKCSRFGSKWVLNKKHDQRLVYDLVDKYMDLEIRRDWDTIRDTIMKKGLLAKFRQDERLRMLLQNTNKAILMEDSPKDTYWGIGIDGTGKNMLGKLLMEVRAEI